MKFKFKISNILISLIFLIFLIFLIAKYFNLNTSHYMNNIKIFKTTNNITVGLDQMQHVKTISVMVCVKTGSVNENETNNGISHFLEHMAFKGTKTRTAFEIAKEIDLIGAYINAYTSKETTCYYVKSIDKHLEKSIDILSDIMQNSTFDEKELETERGVILQELAASLDSPDDVNYNNFMKQAFGDSSLGRTILGPKKNIEKITRDEIIKYVDDYYYAENIFITVAGNINKEETEKLINKYFSKIKSKKNESKDIKFEYKAGINVSHKKDLEQMQFLIGFEAPSYKNQNEWYKIDILTNILGSGMSSRLFQEIREKRGLVYTIYSGEMSFVENGLVYIYAGLDPTKIEQLIKILKEELIKICDNISDEEMLKAKNQTTASIAMASESASSRGSRMAYSLIRYGKYISDDEIIQKIENTTKEDVENIAKQIFNSKFTVSILSGNKNKEEIEKIIKNNFN